MIVTREISRQVNVTFKTRKAAERRVERDLDWFRGGMAEGQQGDVVVVERWDDLANDGQGRTLYDVTYVVSEVLDEAPAGADVLVSGPSYGYRGRVSQRDRWGRVHVVSGRSSWILQAHDAVRVLDLDGSAAAEGDQPLPSAWFATSSDVAPVVHLPRTWEDGESFTACGEFVGPGVGERPRFEVLTDPEERADVTCERCLAEQPADEDTCSAEDCGASLLDNEGWDGLCGNHADAAERQAAVEPVMCEWFARCDRLTLSGIQHPVLGLVPCCPRCAERVGETERLVLLPS